MHLAELGRAERLDRGGGDFHPATGRLYGLCGFCLCDVGSLDHLTSANSLSCEASGLSSTPCRARSKRSKKALKSASRPKKWAISSRKSLSRWRRSLKCAIK